MNLRELEKSTEELILKNRYNEDNINLKKERLSSIKENSLAIKGAITEQHRKQLRHFPSRYGNGDTVGIGLFGRGICKCSVHISGIVRGADGYGHAADGFYDGLQHTVSA